MPAKEENAQLLTRKTVYRGRIIQLDLERVQLPGGPVHELEVIRHPGASCIVPFVSEDEVLLLRQYRHAGGGFLHELPAGTLEAGEHPDDCAARELEEETGFKAGRLEKLGLIRTTPGFSPANTKVDGCEVMEWKPPEAKLTTDSQSSIN